MLLRLLRYFKKNKTEIILVVIILVIAAFFRLYKISDYMTFLGDEGRDAIVAKEILSGDFTLLGPRASAGDFFLGPIYYYMMAPFLLLANYDPVGPAIMIALFGIATVYLVFYVGKKLFNLRTGLIAASLYAISPVVIAYSRSSWNPNLMPFVSLLILYLLYYAIKNQGFKLFIFIGFLLGIAMQLHYLTIFLGVIVFLFVLLGELLARRKMFFYNSIKNYLLMLAGFLVGLSPFLLFEIRHGFPNIVTIFKFIFSGSESASALNYTFAGNIFDVFFRLFARLVTKFPPPEQVNVSENFILQIWMALTILISVIAIYFLFRVKDKLKLTLIGLWLFVGVFLFGFYSKSIYDYYLGFMFPLPFLLVGNLIDRIAVFNKNNWLWVGLASTIFIGLVILNLSGNPFRFEPNKQKDQAKNIAETVLSKTNNKPFNFALLTRGNSDHVYRYFFEVNNKAPVTILNTQVDPERKSVTDQLMIVCEYSECQPLGNSLWEVAGFGRAEIAGEWYVPFVKIYKLVHYLRQDDFSLDKLKLDTVYENTNLGLKFSYPQEFIMKDETNNIKQSEKDVYLYLQFTTPDVDSKTKNSKDFNWKKYHENTIRITLTVKENKDNLSLLGFLEKDNSKPGIDGKIPVIESIRLNLRPTDTPKSGSYVYEGTGGGEHPAKTYYFLNQNYYYEVYMATYTDTGEQYTPDAEKLFDEIVGSIKFN